MAPQTLTSTASTPTDTGLISQQLNGRNSIPFSFLIAFLALFVAFMCVGLFARRIIYAVRRRLGLPVPEPRQRNQPVKRTKPVLWDVYPEKSRDVRKWTEMEPLSCWFLRESETSADAVSVQAPARTSTEPVTRTTTDHNFVAGGRMGMAPAPPPSPEPQILAQPRLTHLSLFHALIRSWRELTHPVAKRGTLETPQVDALRVAVLVAMPSRDRHWKEKASRDRKSTASGSSEMEEVGQMSLGIAEVPWEWGETLL